MGEEVLTIKVVGNAFLHSMVRTIVGTLVMVGRGLRKPEWVREVLEARRPESRRGRMLQPPAWCFGRCSTDGGQAGSQALREQGGKKTPSCEVHPSIRKPG